MNKDKIRSDIKAQRKSLSADFITSASNKITDTLISYLEDKRCVMIYLSAFNEPDTFALAKELHKRDIKTVVPVSDTDSFTIIPSVIKSVSDLQKGAYGIYEPKAVSPVDISEIEVVIVPGIAFTKSGDRLGFGKGYYDRLLSDFKGVKIGVCYDFQIIDNIPVSPHDVSMDLIITESRIYNDF